MKLDSFSAQILQRGLDSAWLKYQVSSNNMANYETPGYKAQEVNFQQVLRECDSHLHGGSNVMQDTYKAFITKDERTEARVDGNNVSMENEQMELWRAQSQYAYLMQKTTGYFNSLRDTMTQFAK